MPGRMNASEHQDYARHTKSNQALMCKCRGGCGGQPEARLILYMLLNFQGIGLEEVKALSANFELVIGVQEIGIVMHAKKKRRQN